jgi:hypothetical protein
MDLMDGKNMFQSCCFRYRKKRPGPFPKSAAVVAKTGGNVVAAGFLMMALNASSVAAGDELAGAYTRLVLLAASDDINVSSFRSGGIRYSSYALPRESAPLWGTDNLTLSGSLRAGWLDVRSAETLNVDGGTAVLHPRWTAGSLGGGALIRYSITPSLTLKGGLEGGVISLKNRSRLTGGQSGAYHSGMKDQGLLDWSADLVRVSPSVGVRFQQPVSDRDCLTLDSRLTWHILFPVAGDKGNTGRGAGTWSFRTEYRFADVFAIAGSPVDILLSEQPGGFWGRGYRDIDFGFITETGIAAEVPVPVGGATYRLRLGAGWLVNDTGTGVSVILGLD